MRAPGSLPVARLVWTSSERLDAPWARACFGGQSDSAAKLITGACSRVLAALLAATARSLRQLLPELSAGRVRACSL
jgi:hypothetical protein